MDEGVVTLERAAREVWDGLGGGVFGQHGRVVIDALLEEREVLRKTVALYERYHGARFLAGECPCELCVAAREMLE